MLLPVWCWAGAKLSTSPRLKIRIGRGHIIMEEKPLPFAIGSRSRLRHLQRFFYKFMVCWINYVIYSFDCCLYRWANKLILQACILVKMEHVSSIQTNDMQIADNEVNENLIVRSSGSTEQITITLWDYWTSHRHSCLPPMAGPSGF